MLRDIIKIFLTVASWCVVVLAGIAVSVVPIIWAVYSSVVGEGTWVPILAAFVWLFGCSGVFGYLMDHAGLAEIFIPPPSPPYIPPPLPLRNKRHWHDK